MNYRFDIGQHAVISGKYLSPSPFVNAKVRVVGRYTSKVLSTEGMIDMAFYTVELPDGDTINLTDRSLLTCET